MTATKEGIERALAVLRAAREFDERNGMPAEEQELPGYKLRRAMYVAQAVKEAEMQRQYQ